MTSSAGSTKGAVYRKGSTSAMRLGVRLGSGGEGEVWELLDDPVRVLKLYRKPDEDRRRKIESMLVAVPDDPQHRRNHVSICWPHELILDAAGAMAGYTMPRMDLNRFKPVALYWDAHDRAMFAPGFTWKYLCVGAANIASVVDLIHARGHVIGDLNDENFLLSKSALATVVDCDSMQIRCPTSGELFRSLVAREPYLSPEWIGKKLADHDRSPADDNWALAVLVFQLLMEGQHPANGIGFPEDRRDRIRQGIFPLLGASGFQPPSDAHPLAMLSPELQALAQRCFEKGFSNPDARPTAQEWKTALNSFAGLLHQCTHVGEHWYGAHLAACPWCEEKSRKGYDRFAFHALASGRQTQLPPAASPLSTGPVASVSTTSVPSSAAAVQTQPAPSESQGARMLIGVVLFIGVIVAIVVLAISSSSNNRSAESSKASSPSSQSAYSQPADSRPPPSIAQEPAAPQLAAASDAAPASAAAPPQQTGTAASSAYPPLDPSMAVPAIPYQPVASRYIVPFEGGAHVRFSYPDNWTVTPDSRGVVDICQDGTSRTLEGGHSWCYYSVAAGLEVGVFDEEPLLSILRTSTASSATGVISVGTPQDEGGGWFSVTQIVTAPFGYAEKEEFIMKRTSKGMAWIVVGAPDEQWSASYPIQMGIVKSMIFF